MTAANENGDLAAAEQDAVTQLGRLLNVSSAHDAVARESSNVPAAYDLVSRSAQLFAAF